MATSTIIIAVFACLFVLIAVTITLQQIEKANAKKSALVAALKGQTRNFQQLLEGFPDGFLSRDLKLLVCQCIGEGLDQMARIDRTNPQHQQAQRQLSERVAQLQAQPADQSQYQTLNNPAQMQELQKLLNNLYNVVQRLYQNKRMNAAQAETYSKQVQRLSTRLALDTHLNIAQQALGDRKPRLAIHHYGQAIEKMSKDNADGSFTAQIESYRLRCEELDALDQQLQKQQASSATSAEWKTLEPKEDPLQKKNVYD